MRRNGVLRELYSGRERPRISCVAGIPSTALISARRLARIVLAQKNLEAKSSGLHLYFRIRKSIRCGHHVGETPTHFRITT
jgi:hypothetical protein